MGTDRAGLRRSSIRLTDAQVTAGAAQPTPVDHERSRVLARTTSTRDMGNHLPAALRHDIGAWLTELSAAAFAALPGHPHRQRTPTSTAN
ncbi:hypothetical protein [Nocardia aurea]|uniref:hypothetical protein n=1 Tax=Nocardia aurea TaxID=2144174 RepID=UPI0013009F53|nr:hypothetical protein [Nocardia aurea]